MFILPIAPATARGVAERHILRQQHDASDKRCRHPEHDDRQLLQVGPAHRPDPARGRIEDDDAPDDRRGHAHVPAEHHREDDGRGVDGHARTEPPLDHEQHAGQRPRLQVEPVFQVLVGGVDVQAPVQGDRGDGEDHHRDREPEVVLHEAHAVDERLPGRRRERDGARLRGHDGERDRIPGHGPSRQEVSLEIARRPALVEAEADDQASVPIRTIQSSVLIRTGHPFPYCSSMIHILREKIGKKSVGARHSRRQLPEERQTRVDVVSLAVPGI